MAAQSMIARPDEAADRGRPWPLVVGVTTTIVGLMLFVALRWILVADGLDSPGVIIYLVLATAFIVSRAVAGLTYRPAVRRGELRSVSVIVPAHNEALLIGRTIEHVFASGYPSELLEVIVVDDGSTDITANVLTLAEKSYANLQILPLEKNVGKRRAMAQGIARTRGDLIVVIDSDTLIARGSLEKLVRAFDRDEVAAVSGLTRILNEGTNLLTRLQSVIYEVSFGVHKAAEASVGCVTCCPGCFSAYRRSAIEPLIEEWAAQRFLASDSAFGDDRALTCLVLREGFDVTFERHAVAYTDAPSNLRGYLRQQLRWKKSWIQQGIRASKFMWRRHPLGAAWFYVGLTMSVLSPHVLIRTLVVHPLMMQMVPVRFLVGVTTMAVLLGGYTVIVKRDSKMLLGALAYPFLAPLLVLQLPFAVARISDSRWGTR